MWFLVALFIASFLITAFLSPKPKIENARASNLSNFNFPRANAGDPCPRGYGTFRLRSPNTLWQGDFEAQPIKKKQKTGLFSSKKVTVGYKYFVGLQLGCILGPGVVFKRIWLGKDVIWTGAIADGSVNINLPELYKGNDTGNGGISGQIDFQSGSYDQTQNPYVMGLTHDQYPAYVGLSVVTFRHFYFGNSAQVQAPNFECQYFTNTLNLAGGKNIMPNGLDANPIECLHDIYVTDWGNLGVDPALIDTDNWKEAANTVYAEGNGFSVEIANSNQGSDLTKEILRQVNAMLFQDPQTGLIKLKLIRQDYNLADLPILTPSNVIEVRNYTKKLWEQTYNQVRVKFTNREKDYADDATTQQDFANINFQRRLASTDISFPGIYVGELASSVAARELANLNVPLYSCEVDANRQTAGLGPGDPFILKWPDYEIEQMVVRIRKFGLGTYEDGKITMSVVQDEFAVDATVIGAPGGSLHQPTVHEALTINDYHVWELPYWLDRAGDLGTRAGFSRFAAYAVAPGGYSIGYDAYIVDDPIIKVLDVEEFTPHALLNGAIGRWDGFDDGDVAFVTVDSVTTDFLEPASPISDADVRQGVSLFMIGDEIFSYNNVTAMGGGVFRLLDVQRALIDTDWQAHADNSRVWFINGANGFMEQDINDAESAFLLDVTDQQRSDPEDADIIDLVPVRRIDAPLPPDFVKLDTVRTTSLEYDVGDSVAMVWTERNRTAADIQFENDADQTPEDGTTYLVRVFVDNELRFESDVISDNAYTLIVSPIMAGDAIVRVFSVRGGIESYTGAPFPATFTPDPESLTVDDALVLFDLETVEMT